MSGHVEFVAGKLAMGLILSEYFGFICQFSFHRVLHTHLSRRAGTIGPPVAELILKA
jgi:hypothetical protein